MNKQQSQDLARFDLMNLEVNQNVLFYYDERSNLELFYFYNTYLAVVSLSQDSNRISTDIYKVDSQDLDNSVVLKIEYSASDKFMYLFTRNRDLENQIYGIDLKSLNDKDKEKLYKVNLPLKGKR